MKHNLSPFNCMILVKVYQGNCHDNKSCTFGYAHYMMMARMRAETQEA